MNPQQNQNQDPRAQVDENMKTLITELSQNLQQIGHFLNQSFNQNRQLLGHLEHRQFIDTQMQQQAQQAQHQAQQMAQQPHHAQQQPQMQGQPAPQAGNLVNDANTAMQGGNAQAASQMQQLNQSAQHHFQETESAMHQSNLQMQKEMQHQQALAEQSVLQAQQQAEQASAHLAAQAPQQEGVLGQGPGVQGDSHGTQPEQNIQHPPGPQIPSGNGQS
ncbi:hypothetical protein [Alteromonas sp. a30]|uniref:hypothetical protein n=1 Tax=Alteromonas sp. a30 TaxID=2730917 RepID=UPI0022828261|nr:hypothetical protein [Alteromonas sp. a30]MCY7295016.1 hypothetical protein [Alteromonas sp. a30]